MYLRSTFRLTRDRGGFTAVDLIALLAAIFLIAALAGLILPMFSNARVTPPMMPNSTQLRGIHQGMVTYSMSNRKGGNDGYFPGLDSSGDVIPDGPDTGHSGDGTHPGARIWKMLQGNYFTADYIINPTDNLATVAQLMPGSRDFEPITADHYSYAMLGLLGSEKSEWKETLNTKAIVLGDRAIGTGRSDIGSVWNDYHRRYRDGWHGTITRNDNSTTFESTAEFEETKYGNADANAFDHLFEDEPNASDAFLVFEDATTAYSTY